VTWQSGKGLSKNEKKVREKDFFSRQLLPISKKITIFAPAK